LQLNREWINISDLMSGLMMVFLFISVAYMTEIEEQQDKIKHIITSYDDSKTNLNHNLKNKLQYNLKKWNAQILKDNTIRFNSSKSLFKTGSSELSNKFKNILDNFFPKYIEVLNSQKFRDKIYELRIEGHTSSIWNSNSKEDEKYIKNMSLSQDRAKSVLKYCYSISPQNHKAFLRKKLRANGMAYSNLIIVNGKENKKKSQRVEFRVLTKSEEKMSEIIEELK